jgi:hypothetical protein
MLWPSYLILLVTFIKLDATSWKSSILLSFSYILLTGCRHLSLAYSLPILFIICLWAIVFKKNPLKKLLAKHLLISAPFLIWIVGYNFNEIKKYYWRGHIVSDEKNIRASHLGIHSRLENILFYPKHIFTEILKNPPFFILIIIILIFIILKFIKIKQKFSFLTSERCIYLAGFIIPISILFVNPHKALGVEKIALITLSLFVVDIFYNFSISFIKIYFLNIISILVLSWGLYSFFIINRDSQILVHDPKWYVIANEFLETVDELNIPPNITITVGDNALADFAGNLSVSTHIYEKTQVLRDVQNVMAPWIKLDNKSKKLYYEQLAKLHVAILFDPPPAPTYPILEFFNNNKNTIEKYITKNMSLKKKGEFGSQSYSIYISKFK